MRFDPMSEYERDRASQSTWAREMFNSVRLWEPGAWPWKRIPEQTICFDISDLISFFQEARAPTGVQRVQMGIISALLRGARKHATEIRICAFSEQRGFWVRIPSVSFLKLCDLSLEGGNTSRAVWRTAVRMITGRIRLFGAMRFARGAALVNLGTSWWLRNYLVSVRNAKTKYGVYYIPFVHDLIPLMVPEYCVPDLTREFAHWISAVFDDADHFLVNSQSTLTDLLSSANVLGRHVPDAAVTVVPMNADFRKPNVAVRSSAVLSKYGVSAAGYVLLVSTIEARKNHIGAFSAWLSLIQRNGAGNTPMLVCVGKDGWLNAGIYAELDAHEVLRSRVMMLSNISDAELALLYDNCLFTFYPSHYEGWGLPVTESLCHGKVPLISTVSSLPEAGGPFADYFDAGSEPSMISALGRLIFDGVYRAQREKYIRENFRPRSWSEIGAQIEQAIVHVMRKSSDAGVPVNAD